MTSSGYSGAGRTLSWALTHTLLYLVIRMLTTRTSCPSRACTRLPWSYCAPSSEWLFPMPVDRDPGPCLALLASFLPHERRSSKSECGRNAAASSFTALQLFPLYCLVLSCLVLFTWAPPSPSPSSASSSSHALSTIPTIWLGPVRLCNVHHSLLVPYPASLPVLPFCQPALPVPSPCPVLYSTSTHLGTAVSTVRTVPCHPAGCRNRIAGIIPQRVPT